MAKKTAKKQKPQVAIVMGSDSDLKVMKEAAEALKKFDIPHTIEVISAHRTPEAMQKFALEASRNGLKVIIAGAGGAAHLPGMIASLTTLPVIGVPVTIGSLKGLDALLSIAQMPKGIPVATVAIDNAYNAGLLAARILGVESKSVSKSLDKFRSEQKDKVKQMNAKLKN